MYAALPLDRLAHLLLWPFAVVLVALVCVSGMPDDLHGWFELTEKSLTYWGLVMAAAFGPSAWWAPWRLVWRVVPALDAVFPDLNGTWTGTTKSNWPVHHLMLQAAEGAVTLDRASLATVPLEEGFIKLTIKASLFALRIAGELGRTGGSSHSTTVRVSRDENRDAWRLDYVYRQDTPQPVNTDEGSHVGAATVRLDGSSKPPTLIGEYWTRRRWRSGLNTAGLIEVTRSSR